MTKEQAIHAAKTFRKEADELLQLMKDHYKKCIAVGVEDADDDIEVDRHQTLSIEALENCIMRQGMVLKYIGTPDPYPNSKDPSNTIVEPTADGLKM